MIPSTASTSVRAPGPLSSPFDFGAAFRFPSPFMPDGPDLQANGFERMMRMGQDYLAFVGRRLDRDRMLVADLSAAAGPTDVAGVWTAYLQTAQMDYAEEARRLMDQWLDGAREAPRPVDEIKPAARGEAAKPTAPGEAAKPTAPGEAAKPAVRAEAAKPAAPGGGAAPAAPGEAAAA